MEEFLITESSFSRRVFGGYKHVALYISSLFLIVMTFTGFNYSGLLILAFMLVLSFVYVFFMNRKVLFKVGFETESQNVILSIGKYNKIYKTIKVPLDKSQFLVRQNFSYKYNIWTIKFYNHRTLIFSQDELGKFWTKEMFLQIEKEVNLLKNTTS